MTVASQANILVIHDKVVSLIGEQSDTAVHTNALLQGPQADSLNWTDADLESFLEKIVLPKFGVTIPRQQIRSTVNGWSPTVGDLSIAISNAIYRRYHPRRKW